MWQALLPRAYSFFAKIPMDEGALFFVVMNSPVLLIVLTTSFIVVLYIISVLVSVKILQNKEM